MENVSRLKTKNDDRRNFYTNLHIGFTSHIEYLIVADYLSPSLEKKHLTY